MPENTEFLQVTIPQDDLTFCTPEFMSCGYFHISALFASVCVCVCVFMHGHHLQVTFSNTSFNSCVFVSELIAVTSPEPSRVKVVLWQSAPQTQEPFYLITLMLH